MPQPLYRQVAENLRLRIEAGEFPPGTQLPGEGELGVLYGASRNTIRDAIRWLAVRGIAETRPGRGTFVTEARDTFVTVLPGDVGGGPEGERGPVTLERMDRRHAPVLRPPRVEILPAAGVIAARLCIPEGTEVVSRRQECFVDGDAWSLRTSYYPLESALRGARRLLGSEVIAEGASQYLAACLGLEECGHRTWVTVRIPDADEAEFLGIPASGGMSVLEIFHAAFGRDGTAIRLTVAVFAAGRNQFIVDDGDVPPATG